MLTSLAVSTLAVAAVLPSPVQDAQAVMATVRERQAQRWETVDNYTVYLSMQGQEVPVYYEKMVVDEEPWFRLVNPQEWMKTEDSLTPDQLRQMADGYEMVGNATSDEMAKQGNPMAFLPGMSPRGMMNDNARVLRMMAEGQEEFEASDKGVGDAEASARAQVEFARSARLVGREEVDGQPTFHLQADDMNIVASPPGEDTQFTLTSMSLWIHAEDYVPVKMTIAGTATSSDGTRELTIERLDQDYRQVGPLYESFRQVMRMSGVMGEMDPKQREDMEKARQQMEELEAQMDQIPAAARSMVEGQLEKARAQMAALSEGGTLENVVEVIRIEYNQGPPVPSAP